MHFELYLKKKGAISAEQLVAAIEVQLKTLPRIGQVALEEGILSPREIFEVLREQSHMPNMRFGEMAVAMGLLTRDELTRLLMIQADRKRPITEILIERGVLNEQRTASEMAEFRRLQAARRRPSVMPSKIAAKRHLMPLVAR
jgi:hypothetical protein